MNYEQFCWDWKETAPIGAIVNVIKEHPDWKIFAWDTGGDFQEIIITKNLKAAKKAYAEIYAQMLEEEEDAEIPEIKEWTD
jgi:hypothetical protein